MAVIAFPSVAELWDRYAALEREAWDNPALRLDDDYKSRRDIAFKRYRRERDRRAA